MQAKVKPEMQGRVMGVIVSLANLITPIGLGIAGPISDAIGIRTWYWLAGLICLLMGIAAFFTPLIMNLENHDHGAMEQSEAQVVLGSTE
jgi:DHA3 family macrolide efflux protein-like MFS transporter